MGRERQKMSKRDDEPMTNQVGLRIPSFWPDDPELWFAQLDGYFTIGKITDDDIKYSTVLSRIEPKEAREVRDVIKNPPSSNKYKAIKTALVQRLSDSQGQRIKQLLEQEELGDRKPSQFLRHLATLAGTTVPDELLRTLWLGRLPPQTQAILASRADDKLYDVAEQADRIHEVNHRALVLSTAHPQAAAAALPQNQWMNHIEVLTKQVAALTMQMTTMAKTFQEDRERSRSRNRSRGRPRSRTPKKDSICYYHRRFGADAYRCAQPCSYKAENEKGDH